MGSSCASDSGGIGGANDVSGVDQPHSRHSVDGRADARIVQLQLGLIELRLVRLDGGLLLRHQRALIVDLLLRDEVLLAHPLVAFEGEAARLQLGGVAGQRGLRLRARDGERPRINLGEQIALVDCLALLERGPVQPPVHLRLDHHRLQRHHGAYPLQVNGDIAHGDLRGGNGHGLFPGATG